ncbi:MAG: class IV adenylate cyclase [Thermoleophilia bacterium]|nr:class IV adenylate cyclase [Thermoleophilia bacterium]
MEIEIKLPFESASLARERLASIGAVEVEARQFEDNVLFEREFQPLKPAKQLLRLRRMGPRSWLTYKADVPGQHRHKIREEHETPVEDPDAVGRILEGLGFHPSYRYQKYRTTYRLDQLVVCLDETPLGCFVELEGSDRDIDRAAALLGRGPEQYVTLSYRQLHEAAAGGEGAEPGDMVFDGEAV